MKNDNLKEQYRINERIRVREVRLVGDNIETGVYPIAQALKIAEEQGMDLVEISPNAAPPVCRVIDYQKFLYQQKKRQKEQKAKSVKVAVKEIRFGPQTDDHDYNFKLKHAKGFLEEGSKVKAYVFFKGRSILFKEQGEVLLLRFANDLEDYGKVEQLPVLEGKRMIITLARECGCQGDLIGLELAKMYQLPFYDRKKVSDLIRSKGTLDRFPDFYGENPVDTLSYSILLAEDDQALYKRPKQALGEIMPEDDFILLGRCGNYAYCDREDALRIFLMGQVEQRVETIAKKHGVSVRKAKETVKETDERRRAYHLRYTGQDWGYAGNYDLCLNVSRLGTQGVMEAIQTAVRTITDH